MENDNYYPTPSLWQETVNRAIQPELIHYFTVQPDAVIISRPRSWIEPLDHRAPIKLLDPKRALHDKKRAMNMMPRIVYMAFMDVVRLYFKSNKIKLDNRSFSRVVMEAEQNNGFHINTAIFLYLKDGGGNEEICTLSSLSLALHREFDPEGKSDPSVTIKLGPWYNGAPLDKGQIGALEHNEIKAIDPDLLAK